jgi:hypothetical protein
MIVRGFNGMTEDSTVYRFAPHFGRTHIAVNKAAKSLWGDRLSDHDPLSVDLPFNEPPSATGPAITTTFVSAQPQVPAKK